MRFSHHIRQIKTQLLYFDSLLIPLHHLIDAQDQDSKAVAAEAATSLEMAGLAFRKLILTHMNSDTPGISTFENIVHRQTYFNEAGFSAGPDRNHLLGIAESDLAHSMFVQEREHMSFLRHAGPEYRKIIETHHHAFPQGARESLGKAMALSPKLADSDVETGCLFAGLRNFSSHEAVRAALCMIEVSMYQAGSDAGVTTAGIVPFLAENPTDDPWRRSSDGIYCYLYSSDVFMRLASNFISLDRLRCINRLTPNELDRLHRHDSWRAYLDEYHNILLEITEECEAAGHQFNQGESMTALKEDLSSRLLSGKSMVSWVAGAAKNLIPFVKDVDFKADNLVTNYFTMDFNRTLLKWKSPSIYDIFSELDSLLGRILTKGRGKK